MSLVNYCSNIHRIHRMRCFLGNTEGRVYALDESSVALPSKTKGEAIKDPGKVIFQGQAASLFRPHPLWTGWFGAIKWAAGQQITDAGDLKLIRYNFVEPPNDAHLPILYVEEAELVPQTGLRRLCGACRHYGRILIADLVPIWVILVLLCSPTLQHLGADGLIWTGQLLVHIAQWWPGIPHQAVTDLLTAGGYSLVIQGGTWLNATPSLWDIATWSLGMYVLTTVLAISLGLLNRALVRRPSPPAQPARAGTPPEPPASA